MGKSLGFSVLCMVLLGGCSTKQPVLYPNNHLQKVGTVQAERDIEECYTLAARYLKSKSGKQAVESAAKSGTVGAAAAAGATRSLLRVRDPSPVFMNYVNNCLRDKGYQTIGWE